MSQEICNFDQIYQLGDSISDTGNLIREFPVGSSTPFARLPYGETFFKNATGRCSNGLLMIDYIAKDAGLPFLPAYKDRHADFKHGVNFAVAGSTALPSHFLAAKHNILSPTALFMVGEIGGNDYNYAIFQGKTMDELQSMVPEVVHAITNAVKRVISFGATRIVVPGNFPIGCLPIYKTAFHTNKSAAYDENRCLKQLNDFAMYHNQRLQQAIQKLQKDHPNAIIVYADYYNAYQYLLHFGKSHGFDTERACCGSGGKYSFNMTRMCGAPGVGVCADPGRFLSWDGIHLTQQGYKIMAEWLVHDIFTNLHCRF
ncbi:UNVERIFIED_CONTAM: Acetylajmalan esterase [Sesamum latifolium]|uniref:Acetylajmalan esterase n=1 Tax=Sesamum latifolium TaxID=2727402 RepID=A0AAW2TQV2_9LAMI